MEQEPIAKQWDPFVVIMSYCVSALGSYTTLQIISQTRSNTNRMLSVQMWLLFGSLVFGGCAVWSMHFLGMMALTIEGVKIGYEPILTVVSLLVPVIASHIAFQFMQFYVTGKAPWSSSSSSSNSFIRLEEEGFLLGDDESSLIGFDIENDPDNPHRPLTPRDECLQVLRRKFSSSTSLFKSNLQSVPCWRIMTGAFCLAVGVFSMHFIGMLAMRMNAVVSWNWGYIVASFFIAWMAAASSLYIVSFCYTLWQQFVAALLMSLAVCGMHFVGMASATYYPSDDNKEVGNLVFSSNFATIISIVSTVTSFAFFGIASGNTTIARNRLEREIVLRKTMEKLRMEKEAAVLADRAKTAFVATVSHEIRTPMNIIIGATELLSSTKQNEEQKELTNTIQLEVLGFSPMEVIEDIVSMSTVSVLTNVDLLLRVASNANVRIMGDPVRFQQIVLNLVSNAIKFTTKGFILVDMGVEEYENAHRLVVTVEDSGIGIASDACDKIFEPFVQADSSHARRFGGTGLGLSVCKQLVELMGGTIEVKSVVNKGTAFKFWFPFEPDTVQTVRTSRVDVYSGLKCYLSCRTTRSNEILKSFLEEWGISVECTEEHQVTFPKKYVSQYDIVIVDVELLSTVRLEGCEKPIVITNPRNPRPKGLPSSSVLIRRPVFGERLFSAVSKVLRDSPSPLSSSPITSPRNVSPNQSPRMSVSPRDTPRPRSPSPAPPRTSIPKSLSSSSIAIPGRQKILLVEDNKVIQQIAIKLLKKLGLVDIDVADNGLEAVNAVSTNEYQAVFMDCQMPVMDGFEATRQIRQRETQNHLPRTKIIALTAGVSDQLRKECLDAGMDTYITKPVTIHTLRLALGLPENEK